MPASPREFATLAVERHADGLVVLAFAEPEHRQNVLTARVLADLSAAWDDLEAGQWGRPRGVVIRSARPGSFFAGADVERLEGLATLPPAEIERLCDAGRGLFSRLATAAWPSVAVIDGVCLGGGLELALACDLRIATAEPHTSLGLPEVKLGLLPGWGGTVRLPRLIGPGPAVEFAVSGEPIDGPAAARLGLVDACVPAAAALESARRLVAQHAAASLSVRGRSHPWPLSTWPTGGNAEGFHGRQSSHPAPADLLHSLPALADRRRRQAAAVTLDPTEREFLEATAAAVILGRTGGHYPAPPAILRTILAGSELPAEEAGRLESQAFAELARTPVSVNLIRVFRLGERTRRDRGVAAQTGAREPVRPRSPAVVGAGIMGSGIAAAHLRAGFSVTLVDTNPEALATGVPAILDEAAWDKAARRTDPARAAALSGRLFAGARLAAVETSDLVLESVTERPDVKRQVLAEIERTVGPATVIATNTSTNPIARLAEGLADPSRFCGLHFFNPVRRMTLVEVVRGPATSDATVAAAVAHGRALGKCPIVVRDSPGFLVNRVLMPYLHEAVELLRAGVAADRIDRVARGFGMPLGPIELYDMVGLDTAFYAGLVMGAAFGDRIEPSPVIPALVKAGLLGRKSGAGFYRCGAGDKPPAAGLDPAAADIVARYALPDRAETDRSILDRLLLPMLLEGLRTLDEGIVRDAGDIDLAVIHALGFPAFRGGLFAWADGLGAAEVVRRLEPLAGLGKRMLPTERLLQLARAGGRFAA